MNDLQIAIYEIQDTLREAVDALRQLERDLEREEGMEIVAERVKRYIRYQIRPLIDEDHDILCRNTNLEDILRDIEEMQMQEEE